jgi:hypothetical protein
MICRRLLLGTVLPGDERERYVTVTYCSLALWHFGKTRSWIFGFHREKGYAYACLFGLELSMTEPVREEE